MYTQNSQMAVGKSVIYIYIYIYIYSSDVIFFQITALTENVVLRKLRCSKVGDFILKLLIFETAILVIIMYD